MEPRRRTRCRPNAAVSDAVGRAEHRLDLSADHEIIEKAVAALTERQSTWRPAEITRELAAALPTTTHLSSNETHELVEQLRQEIEDHLLVDPSGTGRRTRPSRRSSDH